MACQATCGRWLAPVGVEDHPGCGVAGGEGVGRAKARADRRAANLQHPSGGRRGAEPVICRQFERGWSIASPAVYKVTMTERAMQEATFLILTALAAGSQHGY